MDENRIRAIVREEIKTAACRDCAPNGTRFLTEALDKAFAAADAERAKQAADAK